MDTQHSHGSCPAHNGERQDLRMSRRTAIKLGMGAVGVSAATLGALEAFVPNFTRLAHAAPPTLPAIQFDISSYFAPVQTLGGVRFRFGPVYTLSVTAQLSSTPGMKDQQALADALNTIEAVYPFSPGVFSSLFPMVCPISTAYPLLW